MCPLGGALAERVPGEAVERGGGAGGYHGERRRGRAPEIATATGSAFQRQPPPAQRHAIVTELTADTLTHVRVCLCLSLCVCVLVEEMKMDMIGCVFVCSNDRSSMGIPIIMGWREWG